MLTFKFTFEVSDLICSGISLTFLKRPKTWAVTALIATRLELQGEYLSIIFFYFVERSETSISLVGHYPWSALNSHVEEEWLWYRTWA